MLSSFGHYLRAIRDSFKKIQTCKDELLLYWSRVLLTFEIQIFFEFFFEIQYFFGCNQSLGKSISNLILSYIKYLPPTG